MSRARDPDRDRRSGVEALLSKLLGAEVNGGDGSGPADARRGPLPPDSLGGFLGAIAAKIVRPLLEDRVAEHIGRSVLSQSGEPEVQFVVTADAPPTLDLRGCFLGCGRGGMPLLLRDPDGSRMLPIFTSSRAGWAAETVFAGALTTVVAIEEPVGLRAAAAEAGLRLIVDPVQVMVGTLATAARRSGSGG